MIRLALASAILALAACSPPASDTAATAPPAVPPAPYTAAPPPVAPAPFDPAVAGEGPIPVEFRGSWAIEAGDCTKDPGLTRIAVSQNAVNFYEGQAKVVTMTAPHERALTMEVDHSAEGQTSRETHTLAIDDAGKLAYKRRDNTFTYTRCG
jgi:hypothetical protein